MPGRHLILELYGASGLDDLAGIEQAFHRSIRAAGASLLHMHFHVFTPYGGLTGAAILAESHMSIHTWPESRYAAFDAFMCGACDPLHCLLPLLEALRPHEVEIRQMTRGAGLPMADVDAA